MGAVTRVASKFPPVLAVVELINPSVLVDLPPAKLGDELGEKAASDLKSSLLAHARKMDSANSLVSAIEDGIRQRARAVGFRIEDWLVVSVDGSPPIGDLFENPSKYTLTSEQKKFIDEVQSILNDVNAGELAAGVKKNQIFSG